MDNNVGKSLCNYFDMHTDKILFSDSSSSPFYNKQTDQNFFDHLEEFFERANRYCSLKIRETGSKVSNNGQTANKKLLLLKDFPPMIFKNLERWHNLLL